MAESRITVDMVVADLAGAIDAFNAADERHDDMGRHLADERKEGLVALLSRLPCDQPEYHLLLASLAVDEMQGIADRALGSVDASSIAGVNDAISQALHAMAHVVRSPVGTPWRTISDHFIGHLIEKEPPPDPLVKLGERNRRLAEEFEACDEKTEPERNRLVEQELVETTRALFFTPARTSAGAMAQVRRVLHEIDGGFGERADDGHARALRSVLAVLEGRA